MSRSRQALLLPLNCLNGYFHYAVLAAQDAHAETGVFPELLSIYPCWVIRR